MLQSSCPSSTPGSPPTALQKLLIADPLPPTSVPQALLMPLDPSPPLLFLPWVRHPALPNLPRVSLPANHIYVMESSKLTGSATESLVKSLRGKRPEHKSTAFLLQGTES